jgi:YegS/Rv2252/BmrU family lipid kinase
LFRIRHSDFRILMSLCFIVNPRSGTDRVKAIADAIDSVFEGRRNEIELRYTEYAGHGTLLAREAAAAGAQAVIAVGGDGSVRDIAKGLMGSEAVLGIVPKGSGNGLARSLGIPLRLENALRVIATGRTRSIDVGYANEELFLSNAGAGFDALIARAFAASRRRGLRAYSWLVTKHLWQYRAPEWQISADGKEWTERAFMINVANGAQLGYNFKIAPLARPDDGYLDLTIVRHFPKVLGGGIALRAFRGAIHKSSFVQHLRARDITIAHPELRLMQTDGDAHECGPSLRFRIVPGALRVLVP